MRKHLRTMNIRKSRSRPNLASWRSRESISTKLVCTKNNNTPSSPIASRSKGPTRLIPKKPRTWKTSTIRTALARRKSRLGESFMLARKPSGARMVNTQRRVSFTCETTSRTQDQNNLGKAKKGASYRRHSRERQRDACPDASPNPHRGNACSSRLRDDSCFEQSPAVPADMHLSQCGNPEAALLCGMKRSLEQRSGRLRGTSQDQARNPR